MEYSDEYKEKTEYARAEYEKLSSKEKAKVTPEAVNELENEEEFIVVEEYKKVCTHSIVEITVSDVIQTSSYSRQHIDVVEDYRNNTIAAGSKGVDVGFYGSSNTTGAEGSAVVTVTVDLPEARTIDLHWYVDGYPEYMRVKVHFTHNSNDTITYDFSSNRYVGWRLETVDCPAGVNTFIFKIEAGRGTRQWANPSGTHLRVLPEFLSLFGDDNICSRCGYECKHSEVGFGYDKLNDVYFYQCYEKCAHPVDLSSYSYDKVSIFEGLRRAYNALNDAEKAKLPQKEYEKLLNAEVEIAFIRLPETVEEVTIEHKSVIESARQAYNALTNRQKANFSQEKYAKLEEYELALALALVNNQFTKLPETSDQVTSAHKNIIGETRNIYEALTDAEKAKFPQDLLAKIEEYELALAIAIVDEQLNKLPESTDDITSAHKNVINAARAAYDSLTDEQKEKFPKDKLEKLQADEIALATSSVEEQFERLPESIDDITTSDKDAIEKARQAYDELPDDQKSEFPKDMLEQLEAAEIALTVATIDENLPESLDDITTQDKNAIEAARKAYEELSDEEKAKFPKDKLQKLEEAETKFIIATVAEPLSNLPESLDDITNANKDAIEAARKAYDALTDEEKAKLPKELVEKLIAAETKLAYVIIDEEIENLPDSTDEITLNDRESIEAARAAYDSLSDEDKTKVDPEKMAKLEAAETALAHLIIEDELDNVPDSTDDITLDDKESVEAARAAYDSLSDEEKAKVDPESLAKLEAAETAIAHLVIEEELDNVPDSIDKITLDDKESIETARKAYDSLSDEEKAKVDPELLTKLEAAEKEINDIEKALEVEGLIEELINADDITEDDFEEIEAAKAAYDALSPEQQEKVPEEVLNKLLETLRAVDVIVADKYEDEIDNLGEIAYSPKTKAKLEEMFAKYDSLSDSQKELAKEAYAKLEEALEEYDKKELDATRHKLIDQSAGACIETNDGTGIPRDVTFTAESNSNVGASEDSSEYKNIQAQLGENEEIKVVYDIKLTKTVNGQEVEVDASEIKEGMIFIIHLDVPRGANPSTAKIVHISDGNNVEVVNDVRVENKQFIFTTTSLGQFAVVVENTEQSTEPSGFAHLCVYLFELCAVLSINALIALVYFKGFKKKLAAHEKIGLLFVDALPVAMTIILMLVHFCLFSLFSLIIASLAILGFIFLLFLKKEK